MERKEREEEERAEKEAEERRRREKEAEAKKQTQVNLFDFSDIPSQPAVGNSAQSSLFSFDAFPAQSTAPVQAFGNAFSTTQPQQQPFQHASFEPQGPLLQCLYLHRSRYHHWPTI